MNPDDSGYRDTRRSFIRLSHPGLPPVPSKVASVSAADRCMAVQIPTLLQKLRCHSIQLFAGVSASLLGDLLDAASDILGPEVTRPLLFLRLPEDHRTEAIIADIIDQLAEAAAGLWPFWFGGEDFSELNDSALSHEYLPIKLATLTRRCPRLSTVWAGAAIRQLLRGQSPRVPGAPVESEWFQLCHAVNPDGLIAVITLDQTSPQGALALVHALEWLAANGNVAIAALCRELPVRAPPFDRLLYGARVVIPDSLLSTHVDNTEDESPGGEAREASPLALLLPPVDGRPHPQSLIEQRLSKMIEADAELRSKFVFNARVEDGSLKSPKVDLLWAEGRLVIELDGAEHRGRRAYRDDRHRDYELMCAGYVVVRIPNDEIVEDFGRVIENVRLRRSSNGMVR